MMTMAPVPASSSTPAQEALPPLPTYPVNDVRYENFVPINADGYREARARGPGNAAIIIDNGPSLLFQGPTMQD